MQQRLWCRAWPAVPLKHPTAPHYRVYTDGAGLFPGDPLLARAGWGAVAGTRHLAGGVQGVQTSQRAELQSVCEVMAAVCSPLHVVTDSRFVWLGIRMAAAGRHLADWQHADLWAYIQPHCKAGSVQATWIKAHCDEDTAKAMNIPLEDWAGNATADQLAGEAARAALPPEALVQARVRKLQCLRAVQWMLAHIQAAVLRRDRARHLGRPPRVRPTWPRLRRTLARMPAPPRAAPAEPLTETPGSEPMAMPDGLHDLWRDDPTLRCRRCHGHAPAGQWHQLAFRACSVGLDGSPASAAWSWRRTTHQPERAGARWHCRRCHGSVGHGRHGAFGLRRCPVWEAALPEGVPPGPDWGMEVAARMRKGRRAGQAGQRREATPAATAAAPGPAHPHGNEAANGQPPLSALGWRQHAAVAGPGLAGCLVCGRQARGWATLSVHPCGGWCPTLPARVAAVLVLEPATRAGGAPGLFAAALAARLWERQLAPD